MSVWKRSDAGPVISPRRAALVIVTAVFVLALAAAWFVWGQSVSRHGLLSWLNALTWPAGDTRVALPLTWDSPHTNIRPGVRFVGDEACARCHAEIVRTYRQHPMGRSLDRVSRATIASSDQEGSPTFEAQGLEYSVERRGDRVYHKEVKRDAGGRVVSQNEAEARYVIGSGQQAMSFLLERGNGYLFESPITWYSTKQKWGLSPGYENDNVHFERFVKPTCLFCHSNRFDHVDGTENRYMQPIFQGHAIGCERCHGPGELHVKKPVAIGNEPPNVVNPASLSPALREAVCQQCHLQGDIRVVRAGRRLTDYRPGLPLSSIESVFVKAEKTGQTRFFGQVEQMYESRCFRESRGKMGCISCHDPHQLPDPREKAAYYRDRCLNCHAERGCKLPKSDRLLEGQDDRCVGCHMPRSPNEQVPHTATTLHLIGRFAFRYDPVPEARRQPSKRDAPLSRFHPDVIDAGERLEVSRDLGIALATSLRDIPGMTAGSLSRLALPLLEAAVAADASDVPAWEAHGKVLWQLGRREQSLISFQTALAESPDCEDMLVAAGTRAAQLGKREDALDFLGRVIRINPWRADYHQAVSLVHAQRQEWNAAIEALGISLRLNPVNHEARMLLIQCLLANQRVAEARAEFKTLLDQDPPGRDALETWFEKNVPRKQGR